MGGGVYRRPIVIGPSVSAPTDEVMHLPHGFPRWYARNMHVTVKLGSTLREKGLADFSGGEGDVECAAGCRVADVMARLGITDAEVNLIYKNYCLVTPDAHVEDGDRVALFPPNFIHFSQFYLKRDAT